MDPRGGGRRRGGRPWRGRHSTPRGERRAASVRVSAADVGVPLRILLYKAEVMLNPRIKKQLYPSRCLVDTDSGQEWIPYHRMVDVEFETAAGATYVTSVAGHDACAIQSCLRM